MPQARYYHHGRYYRPARPMPLLPPLTLVPAVDPSKHDQLRLGSISDDYAVTRRWKSKRDKEFRWMIRYIGESLTGENVADMRFLCRDHVHPSDLLRQSMNGARLLAILEQQRLLAENSLFFLQTLLYYTARPDLYELVHEFRSKRQNDFRKMGVEIIYDMNHPNERGMALSKDLKSFRKSLKPRSRFNTVDVQAMMKRLTELKTRMHSQLPKTRDRSYANSVLSTFSQSDISDSDWEDVDSDVETADDGGHCVAKGKEEVKRTEDSKDANINQQSGSKKEVLQLPDIRRKTALEVTVKTGRDGESESEYEEDFDADDDDETPRDRISNTEARSDRSLSLSGDTTVRILGPSKPIHNLTHRSTEFSDLKIAGKQTYNDDNLKHLQAAAATTASDVRQIIHGRNDKETDGINVQRTKVAGTGLNVIKPAIGVLGQVTHPQPRPDRVPMKIRTMRKRFRRHSHGIHTTSSQKKRHRTPKTLPKIKSDTKSSDSLEGRKTTITVPTHDPKRMNFLPDIYDKYARRSVANPPSKTSAKRKNKKR